MEGTRVVSSGLGLHEPLSPMRLFSHGGSSLNLWVNPLRLAEVDTLCELTHAYAYLCKFGGQFIY